ncbi:hemicentin-1 [Agrilus planipennis]|uniref:Hemicentin-1 n=1 Tax=Agrilus planipennis TaxID=224129 RepID=A0A1W4WFE3_AGRPL|nr:hemicentin-1 [Agrilus planipennis]
MLKLKKVDDFILASGTSDSAQKRDCGNKPVVKIEKITVNSAENYDSELICTVHAVPDAMVNWKKNDVNIKPDDRITIRKDGHSYILKISKTQKSDFGEYTCSAVNRVGKSEKNVQLTGTPSPARYFKGYEDREKKVPVLSWTIESNSPITEHVLQYRKVGDEKWNVVKPEVSNPEGNIYTIKQELPNLGQGQYEAKVRSRNTYGWSQWSETKNFNGVVAQRTHNMHHDMHHSHPSTTYDLNHSGPETKSLDNENAKENIRQDASSLNSGQARSILSSLLFLCLAFLATHQQ